MDMTGLPPATALPPPEEGSQQSAPRHWRSRFIECLAATSNLAEAAAHAGVSVARACQTRRNEPEFARQWLAALAEGYLFLELDLVRRLREGDFKGKDAERYDVANAIRLLAAHRDGLSRRPLTPVHPRLQVGTDAEWNICWTRRARGQWRWDDGVDVALIEEREAYLVGYGPTGAPFAAWSLDEPQIGFTQAQRAALLSAWGPADLWVRQVGTFGQSPPLFIASIS